MINKKNLKFWIPIGVVVGTQVLSSLSSIFFRIQPLEWKLTIYQVCLFFGFQYIFFIFPYCIFFIFNKNRLRLFCFLILYVFAFTYPSFFIFPDIKININSLIGAFLSSCYAFIVYLASDRFIKQKRTQELEKKNLQSELAMLKNQINPHFLFNTLNNIDSMIQKKPDCASQSIVELSEMMRYMIYEANVEKVSLKKELDYIDNYLHLQKLQYGNQELVEYTVSGEPEQTEVAPMLFIPFVENAFKHCTNKETKHAIRFSFLLDARQICFEATNISDKTQNISKDKTSGIGLDTVKRRLEILYPQRYDLQIQEINDLFCVSLKIKIND